MPDEMTGVMTGVMTDVTPNATTDTTTCATTTVASGVPLLVHRRLHPPCTGRTAVVIDR